jgi:hypothetical protein
MPGKESRMSRTQEVYRENPHSITIFFDAKAPNAREALRAFRKAFGEHQSDIEALYPPHHFCLHLYPGEALGLAR